MRYTRTVTSTIVFTNLSIQANRIDVDVVSADDRYHLWFEFSQDVPLSCSKIAIAFSTLCGSKYDTVKFDFPVSEHALRPLTELTKATIEIASKETRIESYRQGNLLSFSGGFDSLAAKFLMPRDTHLVSMDFGGRFARERQYFETFNTLCVSTNLVDTPFRHNSWSFMGIGAILASDYYNAKYHTFGGILEAGPDNISRIPQSAANVTFPPFRGAGLINAPYVLGLTEIGTLRVMLSTAPEQIPRSLLSVASPGEEKLYRKLVLARLVAEQLGVSVEFPQIAAPSSPHYKFGDNFAVDLLTLYVASKTDSEHASTLCRDIPEPAFALARNLDMNFMERANPTLYSNFPDELAPALFQKLAESGIRWYTENDWDELQEVRNLLLPAYIKL